MKMQSKQQQDIKPSTERDKIPDITAQQIYPYFPYSFIGQGGFGNVWLCGLRKKKVNNFGKQQEDQYELGEDFVAQKLYAIKKCLIQKKQYKLYSKFDHPCIIKTQNILFGRQNYEQYCYIVFKNYFTDLKKHVKYLNKLYPQQIQILIKDILSAIEHMGKRNYWHADIKAQNIFICQKGRYILGDLGFVTQIIQQQHKIIDVLMLGAVVWNLCELKWPYDTYWPDIIQIKSNQFIQHQLILNNFGSIKIKTFLNQIFSQNVKQFPKTIKLLQQFNNVKYLKQVRKIPTFIQRSIIPKKTIIQSTKGQNANQKKVNAIKKARKVRNKGSQHKRCPICQKKQTSSNFNRHLNSCKNNHWSDWNIITGQIIKKKKNNNRK